MEKKSQTKGMTLVEIIIALAILAIIAISFLAFFAQNFSNIYDQGRKSSVLMEANSLLDKLYERSKQESYTSSLEIKDMIADVLNGEGYASHFEYSIDFPNLSIPIGSEHIRYYVGAETTQSGISGFPASLLVFYPNHNKHVILTTFVLKGGS